MEPIKKTELRKKIEELQVKIEIEDMLRVMVEKFKHYKQLNKRFTDAIKEIEGFHAWINKDSHKHYISISKSTGPYQRVCVELYVYGEELTWNKILKELDRHAYRDQVFSYKKKIECLDTDIETLKKILAYVQIEGCDVKNFSLYSLKSDLEHAIKYSGE